MDLQTLRKEIDMQDDVLLDAFVKRMDLCAKVGAYKKENTLAIQDKAREREKLSSILEKTPPALQTYACALYTHLFALSRSYQSETKYPDSPLFKKITDALAHTPPTLPKTAHVACQGMEGAYSQLAAEKFFSCPNIFYFNSFAHVFTSIEQGFCQYGVLPIENSTAGSVNEVYDLMMKHNFYIVGSARIKVNHMLCAKKGTALDDIKEIFSHQQAIEQCSAFLSTLKDVKITCVSNTATAAKLVSESERSDVAALCSDPARALYELEALNEDLTSNFNNYTRFILISKTLEIFPGANKTSVMMILPHKPGSLYKVLERFNALGINLIKLESRPIPTRDFEFMFYFDLETSVYTEEFKTLLASLEDVCETFHYLGSYTQSL